MPLSCVTALLLGLLAGGGSRDLAGAAAVAAAGSPRFLPWAEAKHWLDPDLLAAVEGQAEGQAEPGQGAPHQRRLQQAAQGGGGEAQAGSAGAGGAVSLSLAERREVERRCRGTAGRWCGRMEALPPAPLRPAPRGNRTCAQGCGPGNCNHDTGTCDCPAGSQGPDCGTPLLRPCTTSFRHSGPTPMGHIDAEGRDLDWTAEGYTESRCTGICDPYTARCFCDGKHRRVNPPLGSPPGTPAPVRGRPLGNHHCQLSDDGKGHKLPWGQVPYDHIYGPEGWCNSDNPVVRCPCLFDGFSGPLCEEVTEAMCVNQCSGHGECDHGFCRCHAGWYGTDCARKAAGQATEPGQQTAGRTWLQEVVVPAPEAALAEEAGRQGGGTASASTASGPAPSRRRPLIYVYDLPAAYNSRMLQYRNDKGLCTWRSFNSGNNTETYGWTYGLEVALHEMLLQSPHRTFDPEAADFFYVPVYGSCFIFPLHCYADGPWWHAPSGPRVMHVTNMMLDARDWIRQHFPYWDRRGGRDHIWLMTHDEGACYAPSEIYNVSTMLTHWGRTDPNHASNTAFTPDNYTQEFEHPEQPGGWLRLIQGHPCHTPGKDLVIPALKLPGHFSASPLLLAPPRERTHLLFLRGDVGKHRLPNYSRGIRQRLHQLARERGWKESHGVLIGDGSEVPGGYSEQLAASKFCIVGTGCDGWSARMEDAVLHGCVPVIIMDHVQAVWEDQLELGSMAVRVREAELEGLPERLAAVPERVLEGMQRRLRSVWHRFAYASHPLLAAELKRIMDTNVAYWRQTLLQDMGSGKAGPEAAERAAQALGERAAYPVRDDALGTILQWLAGRIGATRAGEDARSALRVIAACLADASRAGQPAGKEARQERVEVWAQALALLLKVHLIAEEKSLGSEGFKARYNPARVRQGDGYTQMVCPAKFLHNLGEPGSSTVPDPQLLAALGGFLGADLLLLRSRVGGERNNGANTALELQRLAADPAVLQLAARHRPRLLAEPRPVVPLLAAVVAGQCVYRGLVPRPGALEQRGSQVTDWRSTAELRIWLPEPACCLVPLYRLRDVDHEAGGALWTVVRSGRSLLVLQRRQWRRGQWAPDSRFGDVPVASIVPGSGGKKVRLLQPEAAGQQACSEGGAAGPPGAQEQHQQPTVARPGDQAQEGAGASAQQPGQQQRQQPPAGAVDASFEAALQAARGVQLCEHITFLGEREEGQAPTYRSAKETAAELCNYAGQVDALAGRRPPLHLVVAAAAGSGKTTFVNKAIAELMAAPERLRALLPPHLCGPLPPAQLPGPGTRVEDLLRLCGAGQGAGGLAGGAAGGEDAPPRRFSINRWRVQPPPGGPDDARFSAGGSCDYFDLEARGVGAEVAEHLRRSWDEQPYVQQVGDKYNLCRPVAGGREYGCFMPNGKDVHCTDRTQHVNMRPPTRLEEAAFRFRLELPSREELNRKIHQYRQYVAGVLAESAMEPLTPVLVPLLCGLRGPDTREEFERLLRYATLTDKAEAPAEGEEGEGEDADSDEEDGSDGSMEEGSEDGRDSEDSDGSCLLGRGEQREEARRELLSRLYPLQRYQPWLGNVVELCLLTDDCVGASRWAEFWTTRFVLGRENAAFTRSGSSVMHVPSARLPVHIMDLPGVETGGDEANALQAEEVRQAGPATGVELGLRELSANAGDGPAGGHTVVVLPSIGRGASQEELIRKLREEQVLQAALDQPEAFTLVPLTNLCPGSNCVTGHMVGDTNAAKFAKAFKGCDYPRKYEVCFKRALKDTAKDLELHKSGACKRLKAALEAGQLLRSFALDVGGSLVEAKPFGRDAEVAPFLFSAFLAFLQRTEEDTLAAARGAAAAGMWQALGGLAFEGLGLAMRLQGPRREGGGGGGGDGEEGEGEEAHSLAASEVLVRKATRTLGEALQLQAKLEAGTPRWAARVRELTGAGAGSSAASASAAAASGAPADAPLTLDGIWAWVGRRGSPLREALRQCTSERAGALMLGSSSWAEAYRAKCNRLLGRHLLSSDLADTNLPDLLLSRFKERVEGLVAGMLEAHVAGVVAADTALLRAELQGVRRTMLAGAMQNDPEVLLLLDVSDESLGDLLARKQRKVLRRLKQLTRQPEEAGGMASLPARWRGAVNSAAAREAAQHAHQRTKGAPRTRRRQRPRQGVQPQGGAQVRPQAHWQAQTQQPQPHPHAQKQRVQPQRQAPQPQPQEQAAQQQGAPPPGSVARIVYDLAKHLLQLYRRKREGVIREAVAAARSSTVTTLGPMALHVVRAGAEAARLCVGAAGEDSPALPKLQAALQKAKEAKAARMRVLQAGYVRQAGGDPLELLRAAHGDAGLRRWVESMAAGGGGAGGAAVAAVAAGAGSGGGDTTRKRRRRGEGGAA
ncbi:hypothetical protein HYH03_014911 [Edaphochlamys debaryana]|uniref:EGF-like domain-containing protein n=1 Tax=Edaphochlamys debaryana TaxID=47281 RepID=A0A835XMX4_9CHLO|nr:hypothetical protein HYH03_014911 [Edaphochlamys debaryana]|eukprot:KAG2486464.1 hypothetical protein HYH03_014911 [Edaphochlamys debaryana]